jgi:acyl-coenzyme A thioesterase 9
MRKAFELGWANCCVYSKKRPYALAVDDISFRKPVEVGSLLYLSSQVTYTSGPFLQVKVHAEVVDPKTGVHQTTNVFHFTFYNKSDVPQVVPKSYAEYMIYVDGKRHFEASQNPID